MPAIAPEEVQVSLRINCGCGFRARKVSEAKEHVEKTGHAVQVLGGVGPRGDHKWQISSGIRRATGKS